LDEVHDIGLFISRRRAPLEEKEIKVCDEDKVGDSFNDHMNDGDDRGGKGNRKREQ
jgi:hypothetical protein